MKPIEIAALIKKSKPELLGIMPERKAAALIREVLTMVGQHVAAQEKGVTRVPALGSFTTRLVEVVKNGKKVVVTRVAFRPSPKKSAK